MTVRLLIFDFDGIIIDTETPDYDSWQEIYREHGCELSMEAWADCIGARAGVFDPCGHLESLLGRRLDRDEVIARRRARFYALVEAEPLRPGVGECITEAKARGIRVAVASSADRKWVGGHLKRFDLLELFDCVKTVENVRHAKPAPDLFLAVLNELNVSPGHAVAFEDSPNGIRAGRTAGITVVAIPNPITEQLPLDEADFSIPSLAHTPLPALLERLENGA